MELHADKKENGDSEIHEMKALSVLTQFLTNRNQWLSTHHSFKHPIDVRIIKRMALSRKYRLGDSVGEGAFGVVCACNEKSTGYIYACKVIPRRTLNSTLDMQNLITEVGAMEVMAGHPHVARLKECFKDDENVHLVMEMCEGGDLFTRIKKLQRYSEREAALVCRKLASALEFAHNIGIMHRDIKPENILLASGDSNTNIRLSDFGSATFFKPNQKLNEFVGSSLYMAPSVLRYSYGPEADLWSVGIVLYILLCGEPPFSGTSNAEIMKNVLHADLKISGKHWTKISEPAKDLVRKLLTRDDEERLTAKQVQVHPWIQFHCRQVPLRANTSKITSRQEFLAKQPFMTTKYSSDKLSSDAASHLSLRREVAAKMTQRNVFLRKERELGRSASSSSDHSDQPLSAFTTSSQSTMCLEDDCDIPIAMPVYN